MDPSTDIHTGQTIAASVAHAAGLLRKRSDAPRLEAELLITHVTGLKRAAQIARPATVLLPEQIAQFERLLGRRVKGEPLAYLLGTRDFWTLTLAVSPAVLIPRPETELVVERALAHLPAGQPRALLDLATGSGAIALSLASERPQLAVTATDLSADALLVAADNANQLGLERVRLLKGSWFEPLGEEHFDVITSNPPYIAAGDPDLATDVRDFEPEMALVSGPTGLECLAQIVASAPHHLEPGGWLVLEHGWRQAEAVRNLLERAGFTHVTSHADLAGHLRVTEGQAPSSHL